MVSDSRLLKSFLFTYNEYIEQNNTEFEYLTVLLHCYCFFVIKYGHPSLWKTVVLSLLGKNLEKTTRQLEENHAKEFSPSAELSC